jgi:transposase-like protein
MRTIFSQEQITRLKQNPCVFRCTQKSIHYTYEFKKRSLDLYTQGISPNEIWKRAGFDVSMWKKGYCGNTLKDWRRLVRTRGIESLTQLGGVQSDAGPKNESFIDADKVKRLELQVKYLQAENDFLAKLRAKKAESNLGRRKNSRLSEN